MDRGCVVCLVSMRIARIAVLSLLVGSLAGCAILTEPTAVIFIEDRFGFAPHSVTLDGTRSYGGVVEWLWLLDGKIVGRSEKVTVSLEEGEHTIKLRVSNEAGIKDEQTTTVTVKASLSGLWNGVLRLREGDDRPAMFELALTQDGGTITGTLEYHLYGSQIMIPITEGTATWGEVYIQAEGNSPPPVSYHKIELWSVPGDILTGDAWIYDNEYGSTLSVEWMATR